jgi:hypothetical protein
MTAMISELSSGASGRKTPRERPARREALRGRAAEQKVIGDLLRRARRGAGGVVLLDGEPGIGKSLLLRDSADEAAEHGFSPAAGAADQLGEAAQIVLARPQLPGDLRDQALTAHLQALAGLRDELAGPAADTVLAAPRQPPPRTAGASPAAIRPAWPRQPSSTPTRGPGPPRQKTSASCTAAMATGIRRSPTSRQHSADTARSAPSATRPASAGACASSASAAATGARPPAGP